MLSARPPLNQRMSPPVSTTILRSVSIQNDPAMVSPANSMRSPTVILGTLLLLLGMWTLAASQSSSARDAFLKKVDSAFDSREPKQIAALADTNAWREAGYPDLQALKLVLPKGPLARDKDLGQTAVLYKDPAGRLWRLSLRRDAESDAWSAVIRASLCPRGGMQPRPGTMHEQPRSTVETWTVLECWPLPK